MDNVATPQPPSMPASPTMAGLPAARATLLMDSMLEAAVLSVGIYSTSQLSQAFWVTEDTSLESVKANSTHVTPAAVSSAVTTSTW